MNDEVLKLYRVAAICVGEVVENRKGLKQTVYSTKYPNLKALLPVVSEVIKHFYELKYIIGKTNLKYIEPSHLWLTYVLLAELLWRNKKLKNINNNIIKSILSNKDNIEKLLKEAEEDIPRLQESVENKPKYVRINTLKTSITSAIQSFIKKGYNYRKPSYGNDYDSFLSSVATLSEKDFMTDMHFKEVLIFHRSCSFFDDEDYRNCSIILEDKASCFPVYFLNPEPGSVVLDTCAAPGVKTSHLAAFMKNKGTLYAVDRDVNRFQELEKYIANVGATCVKTINKDVLEVYDFYPSVDYILVDPSCSGSGIYDRIEIFDNKRKYERLDKLFGFQVIVLKHALIHFPNAKRVVYSTCSLHPEENEKVVQEVLTHTKYFKLVSVKNLLKKQWSNFGSPKFKNVGENCLYCRPEKDLTNGFFVAVFEKLNDGEINPFYKGNMLERNTLKREKKQNKIKQTTDKKNDELLCSKTNNKTKEIVTVPELRTSKRRTKKSKRKRVKQKIREEEENEFEKGNLSDTSDTDNQNKKNNLNPNFNTNNQNKKTNDDKEKLNSKNTAKLSNSQDTIKSFQQENKEEVETERKSNSNKKRKNSNIYFNDECIKRQKLHTTKTKIEEEGEFIKEIPKLNESNEVTKTNFLAKEKINNERKKSLKDNSNNKKDTEGKITSKKLCKKNKKLSEKNNNKYLNIEVEKKDIIEQENKIDSDLNSEKTNSQETSLSEDVSLGNKNSRKKGGIVPFAGTIKNNLMFSNSKKKLNTDLSQFKKLQFEKMQSENSGVIENSDKPYLINNNETEGEEEVDSLKVEIKATKKKRKPNSHNDSLLDEILAILKT